MIRPRHPETAALTTLIHGAGLDDYYPIAQAIEAMMTGRSDESKAELYARIQDTVYERDTFATMETKINAALWATQNAFACHG